MGTASLLDEKMPTSWADRSSLNFRSFLVALIPSFLTSRPVNKKLLPTAYLDGMRGLAALFVFFCHLTYTCFVITIGYGYRDAERHQNNILQLPLIRLLYSGPPMVCVFFVISGYALSLKPLKQMRAKSFEALLTTMSSSIFRRAFRLFLPTFASCFVVFVLLRLGFYEPTRSISTDKALHPNIQELHPPLLESFSEQFQHYYGSMFYFVCIFDWSTFAGSTGYDVHLWTIPVEFRSSLFLFLTIIGLARLKPFVRMSLLLSLIAFVFQKNRWDLSLFYFGMFLAELDLISPCYAITSSPPSSPTGINSIESSSTQSSSRLRTAFWITVALLSLYLMSQPDLFYESTPGWVWLTSQIPEWFDEKYRYYQVIGSAIFVLAVTRLPQLQEPFNHPAIQYLGKISYALYLMHGPVMHVFGYRIEYFCWKYVTGIDTETRYLTGFILASAINIPLVIWASDVFWRAVDSPSVKFARWIENQLVESNGSTSGRARELPQ